VLLDKYLPEYTYSEKHSIIIHASPEKIFSLADQVDMSGSVIIRILFALRGMPARMLNKEGLARDKFIELETRPGHELIIGLIGQFWKSNGNLQCFEPSQFTSFKDDQFLKAVWNFELIDHSPTRVLLETETRIFCPGKTKQKFSRYWFFVRPFSGLIRREILRSIKRKAEETPLANV
jgi:hypothetical protein